MKRFIFIFILINFLLTVFYIDLLNNANTTSRILPIVTYFESGTFQIDEYHELTCDKSFINQHYYSDKAPLPTAIVFPVFALFKSLSWIKADKNGSFYGTHVYAIGTILCSVIPFVMIVFLAFKKSLNSQIVSPVLLSMLPFYASFIFIFSGTFFNHILSALFLLLTYICLKEKKFLVAGMIAGLAFLCEYIIALVLVIWALQILVNERKVKNVIQFGLGIFPAVAGIMWYNYVFTGSPFTMLYKFHYQQDLHSNYGFSHPTLSSVWGLTFSDYRGLFFYTPFLIVALFYFIKKVWAMKGKEILHQLFSNYLFLAAIAVFTLVASYFAWWGGWTYGPRLFLFMAVLLVYEAIIFLSGTIFSKTFFWIAILFGTVTTFMTKATTLYSLASELKHPFTQIVNGFLSLNLNPDNVLTLLFDVDPVVAFIAWILLFCSSLVMLKIQFNKVKNRNG